MSYSIDLRERVVRFVEDGGSKYAASRQFSVCLYTIYKWIKKKQETGRLEDEPAKRGWKKIPPKELERCIEEHPEYKLAEYASYFGARASSISYAMKKLKITRKKRLIYTKNGTKQSVEHFWSK